MTKPDKKDRGLHTSPFIKGDNPVIALFQTPESPAIPEPEVLAEPDDDPSIDEPMGDLPRALERKPVRGRPLPRARTGTRAAPYARKDGVETVKVAFSASAEFAAQLRVFTAALPPSISRNEWMEQVLARAMEREQKRK